MTGVFMARKRKLREDAVPFPQRVKCTVTEAHEYGGIGKNKINDLIKTGRVKSTLFGRRRLIDVPSFLAVLNGEEARPA
jgi:excisionase family DNA binding protein